MNPHQKSAARCPICHEASLLADFRTDRLSVLRCPSCGHRVAEHVPTPSLAATDYHQQYDQSLFLESLEQTRLRQGERVAALIRHNLADARSILDFGAGRGWFLQAATRHGFERLAGADTSELAVRLLRERGFEALQLSNDERLPKASFEPDVLTLLDVIEHFPAAELAPRLRALLRHFRPRLLIVKVPIRPGILYGAASVLQRVGAPAALEQLYQVGSQPPHQSYFSRYSLTLLLANCGLELVDQLSDLDFEPDGLAARAHALARFGRSARLLGEAAGALARALSLQDSLIVAARVSAAERS